MSVKIVTNEKEAKAVNRGDQYVIDVFPAPELEDQTVTQEMFAERDRLTKIVNDNLDAPAVKMLSKSKLNKMKEADLVQYAIDLGLEASVDDKKSDTVQKVLDYYASL